MSADSRNPSWWRCLISSNWWWYGTVNPAQLPPPDKRPKLWRMDVVIFTIALILVMLVPAIISDLNREIPEENTLQTIVGKIVEVQKLSSHLVIKTSDGSLINAEFPTDIGFFGFETRIFFNAMHRQLIKNNPKIEIKGQYIRFLPVNRFRIWTLNCEAHCYPASYEQVKAQWIKYREKYLEGYLMYLSIFFLYLCVKFFREKRKHGNNPWMKVQER